MGFDREEGDTDFLKPRRESDPMEDRGPRPPVDVVAPPWRLLLQVDGAKRTTIGLKVKPRMTIGRADSTGEHIPDIDLNPFDARRNGVSREHAVITYEDDTLYIEDLDSTNGTRINGFQLMPGRSYRLRDGDELEFGRLRAVVRFVRPSR